MPVKKPANAASRSRRSPMEHPRHQYPQETAELQAIAKSCGLTEKIKWGKPCFTLGDRNIVLIQRFNDYIALLFFKGALLADPGDHLHRIGEHTQVPRQLRFRSLDEVTAQLPTIRSMIDEAIALENAAADSGMKAPSPIPAMPDELKTRLAADKNLKAAFAALTPGRQKGYILQIAAAKQSATRAARVDKFTPAILAGKGLHD